MKAKRNIRAMAIGLALTLLVTGPAVAGEKITSEQFAALKGIPAEAMTATELAAVEGKGHGDDVRLDWFRVPLPEAPKAKNPDTPEACKGGVLVCY